MELASRNFQKRCVNGLAKCIQEDCQIGYEEKAEWWRVKEKVRDLFDPSRGGSYAVFDQRPLSSEVERYCTQDVAFMPHLCKIYRGKLCDAWWRKIATETDERIRLSQSAAFRGQGRRMAEAPRGWLNWIPSVAERGQRTLLAIPVRHHKPSSSKDLPTADDVKKSVLQPPADLSKLFEDMKLKVPDPLDDPDPDNEPERRWVFYGGNDYNSDGIEARDFAAYDSECGYCRECPY